VLHLRLIIFSVGDYVLVDSELFLMTDFVNLNINLTQFFKCAHRSSVCMHIFIGVSALTYMSIYVCTIFLNIYIYIYIILTLFY
jgi:hypothetical protein